MTRTLGYIFALSMKLTTNVCYITCFLNVLPLVFTITSQRTASISDTNMFEIPANYRTRFLLMYCQAPDADINCKCKHLGSECQEADMKKCKNCRCLNEKNRTFYIRKRYGAVCVSSNNVLKAGKRVILTVS